jgi:hypothetical protein
MTALLAALAFLSMTLAVAVAAAQVNVWIGARHD